MELFAVIYTVGGFAREDAPNAAIAGIFTDEKIADIVCKTAGFGAKVVPVELDKVALGYISSAKELFNINLVKILKEKALGFRELDELDSECLMTAEEFKEHTDCGGIMSCDGHGNWATDKMVSEVSCWNEKPEWATHVCWYNK